jgi:hypothetical protein
MGVPQAYATKEFSGFCIIRASVSTTGPCGGDTGHGARLTLGFEDLGSTDMSIEVLSDRRFVLHFGGDAELEMIEEVLEWMVETKRLLELAIKVGNEQIEPSLSAR